jgi:PAS domain-containing protein
MPRDIIGSSAPSGCRPTGALPARRSIVNLYPAASPVEPPAEASSTFTARRRFLLRAALAFAGCYALILGTIAAVHGAIPGFGRVDLAVIGVPLALGGAGLVLLGYWWHEMVHDRRITRQLEENAVHLRLLANHVPCAIWTTDRNLVVTSAIGALMQAFKWPPERAIGRPYPEVVESDDPADPGVAAQRRALAGETSSYIRVRGGRSLEVRIDPLRDEDGAVVGCVGVAVEFTKWAPAPAQGGVSDAMRPPV